VRQLPSPPDVGDVRVRIDVHAHYLPDFYRAALLDGGHEHPDGFPYVPEWSAEEHVAVMDRLGIERSMLSVSSPGVLGDVALAGAVNDAGRRAVVDHPGRFGLLASLPLPDVDAAVAEVGRSFDDLDADGFVLLTNVDGTYIGDESFEALWQELDRRHARVLLHPTSPACWDHTSFGRPRPMIEFLFDTTRTIVDLILNGTLARFPDVKVIVPHAGATLPLVAERVAAVGAFVAPDADVPAGLARLHYDLAGLTSPLHLDALRTLAPVEHLHYGSDWPFTPEPFVVAAAERLGDLPDSLGANTEALFPNQGRHHEP
jgi:6-methylsalicylate decarboxylase